MMTVRPAFKNLPFWDHLEELRGRIIKCILVLLIASCFFYQFIDRVFYFLTKEVDQLYFTSPAEAFMAYITLTILGGAAIASPILFYQLWAFVGSALTVQEKKYVYWFGPLSFLLFILGCLFAYCLVFPLALRFLLSFSSDIIVPILTVNKYISFIGSLCLAFGVIFEMPLVIAFLARIGIASPAFLMQMRRHAIVIILVVSAFLTPPDYASQVLMAIPMFLLYELSIILAKIAYRPKFEKK